MSSKSKPLASLLVVIIIVSIVSFQTAIVKAQRMNQSPDIVFQKEFGDNETMGVSNIFQTTDGGYIFMDWGRSHYLNGESAIFYKIDALGNLQWNKTFSQFLSSTVIQTNDEGYELFGEDSSFTPTLIKMNSQGNTQWIVNDSSLEQKVAESFRTNPDIKEGSIMTSDGGYALWKVGSIIKTDSHNNTEWIKNFTHPSDNYIGSSPLPFYSLIETSDGALVALGLGFYHSSTYRGTIYVIKTEPFLPLPSPSKLQAAFPMPWQILIPEITVLVISVLIITVISLLIYLRHKKLCRLVTSN